MPTLNESEARLARSPQRQDRPVLPLQDDNLGVDDIAQLTADAILANRLYVLPHAASRASIRRRFERIDRTFDEQAAEGWRH